MAPFPFFRDQQSCSAACGKKGRNSHVTGVQSAVEVEVDSLDAPVRETSVWEQRELFSALSSERDK